MAQEKGMIEPFVEAQKREGVISYGLSSYGYDARVGEDFKIFTDVDNAVVDPKTSRLTASSPARETSRSRPTALPSLIRSNISASLAMCSSFAWVSPLMRDAASS